MRRLRLALLVVLVAFVAACGGVPSRGSTAGPTDEAPTDEAPASAAPASEAPASEAPASDLPAATADPTGSGAPVATPDAGASDEPAESPGPAGSDEPADGGAAAAEACSGSAANREFFVGIARAVDWPVLCGVLPHGWFVSEGTYRLANGGKLVIGYKGPGGASLTLSEGAFCTTGDSCVPAGTDLGGAALGPLDGTLYRTSGGFAILAAPGENPSWLMTTRGLDQATTTTLAAAMAEVGH